MDRARQFAAFVPDLVLERLASDPAAPATAREDAFLAAILFVDIVGYVRLSGATHRATARRERRGAAVERLATSAAAAADQGTSASPPSRSAASRSSVAGLAGEKMRDVVNATFAGVVDVVRAHGGDVLKFAGDAIFAAWPVKTPSAPPPEHHPNASERRDALSEHEHRASELGEQCLRAVQCALEVRRREERRRASAPADPPRDPRGARAREREKKKPKKPKNPNKPSVPTLKMAVAAGRVVAFDVGGVGDRWEFLAAGEPMRQIERCAAQARPGDVVVSREAYALEEVEAHVDVGAFPHSETWLNHPHDPASDPAFVAEEEDALSSGDAPGGGEGDEGAARRKNRGPEGDDAYGDLTGPVARLLPRTVLLPRSLSLPTFAAVRPGDALSRSFTTAPREPRGPRDPLEARLMGMLFADDEVTRRGESALGSLGDASSDASSASSPASPEAEGVVGPFGATFGGAFGGAFGSLRNPTDERASDDNHSGAPLLALGLTNGFDGRRVRRAVAPARGLDREALFRRVAARGDGPALAAALARYVPEAARRVLDRRAGRDAASRRREARASVADDADASASSSSSSSPPPPPPPPRLLPPLDSLSVARPLWVGEIRRCAVVFVHVRGVDYLRAGAAEAVRAAVRAAHRVVAERRGHIRQILAEEKGSATLIAAFGLPEGGEDNEVVGSEIGVSEKSLEEGAEEGSSERGGREPLANRSGNRSEPANERRTPGGGGGGARANPNRTPPPRRSRSLRRTLSSLGRAPRVSDPAKIAADAFAATLAAATIAAAPGDERAEEEETPPKAEAPAGDEAKAEAEAGDEAKAEAKAQAEAQAQAQAKAKASPSPSPSPSPCSLTLRAGVCTGDAFCALVGTPARCEYALYGDVVNTAARLATHEKNAGALVCGETRALCAETLARAETSRRDEAGRRASDSSDSSPVAFSRAPLELRVKGRDMTVEAYAAEVRAAPRRPSKTPSTPSTERVDDFASGSYARSREGSRTSAGSATFSSSASSGSSSGRSGSGRARAKASDNTFSSARDANRSRSSPPLAVRLTRECIDALPPDARAAVDAAAVLGERFDASLIRATVEDWHGVAADASDASDAGRRFGAAIESAAADLARAGVFTRAGRWLAFADVRSRDAAYALLSDAARRPAHAAAAKALETEGYRYHDARAKKKGRDDARRRGSREDTFRARHNSDASSDETSEDGSEASEDGSRPSSSRFSSLDRLTTLARHWQRGGDPTRASGVLALAGDAKAAEGSFSEAAAWYSAAAATLRASFKEGVVSFETRRGGGAAEGVVLETPRTRVLALAEWTVLESEARLRAGESSAAEKRARDAVELTRVLLSRDDAVAPLDVLERALRNARKRLLGLLYQYHPGNGGAAGAAAALWSVVSRCFGSRRRREKGPEIKHDPRAAAPSVNAGEGAGEDASPREETAFSFSSVVPALSHRRREAPSDSGAPSAPSAPSDVALLAVRARELVFLSGRRRRDALAWRRAAKRFANKDGRARENHPESAAFFEAHARRAAEGAAKARRGDAMKTPREDGDAGRTKRRCFFY